MTTTIQEHAVIRSCACSYEARDISADSKLAYQEARGVLTFGYGAVLR